MKLGIKLNADAASFTRLAKTNAPFAEIWFNVNDYRRYEALFEELNRRRAKIGLHFWGLLPNNISPNIAYPDSDIAKKSMDLMRQTLDIAAQRKCSYVNIHPGSAAVLHVNYDTQQFDVVQNPVETDVAIQTFLEHAIKIHEYAKTKGVILTVETVPARITDGWYNAKARLKPKNAYELPARAIIQASQSGLFVANDFCHTAANVISNDSDAVWTFLRGTTELLAPKTRLIHLGFVMPPYNGTDNHNSLDNPILETSKAVPNKKQMIELLKLFKNRNDIFILVEPKDRHETNYFLAKELISLAERL